MANQFEYERQHSSELDFMMDVDYDMALLMKADCVKQLMALQELHALLFADEFHRVRMQIRKNLKDAQSDIDQYESIHGKPNIVH